MNAPALAATDLLGCAGEGMHPRRRCGVCAALLVVASAHGGLAAAEEVPEHETFELSPAERSAARALLGGLASAMTRGEAAAIEPLLCPGLPAAERENILSRVKGELERFRYLRFRFDLDEVTVHERPSEEDVVVLVPAVYEYEERSGGSGSMASSAGNSFRFRLTRRSGEWRVAGSGLFDQFTETSIERVLGLVFLVGFVALMTVFFWGWMALDALMRTGRARYALLVLASTPVGAGVYFLWVYLRRRLVPADRP